MSKFIIYMSRYIYVNYNSDNITEIYVQIKDKI